MGCRAIINLTDKHTDIHLVVCLWFIYMLVYLPVELSACLPVFIRHKVYKTPCFVLLLSDRTIVIRSENFSLSLHMCKDHM